MEERGVGEAAGKRAKLQSKDGGFGNRKKLKYITMWATLRTNRNLRKWRKKKKACREDCQIEQNK